MPANIATRLAIQPDDSVATALREFQQSIVDAVKAGQQTFGDLSKAIRDIGAELGKIDTGKAKQELASVGEAGKKSIAQVGEAAANAKISLPVEQPKGQLTDLAQTAKRVFEEIKGGVTGVKAEIENAVKSVIGFKAALIGLATAGAIGGIYQFVKSGIEDFNTLKKKADEAKLSLEEFQKLRFIYQEFGLSAKDADKAIADHAAIEGSTSTRTGPNNTGGKIITTNEPVNPDSLRRLSQAVALIDDYDRKVERAQVLLKSKDLAKIFVDKQEDFFKRVKDAGALVEQTEKALKNASVGGVLLAQEAAAAARQAFEDIKGESGIDKKIKKYDALREVVIAGEKSAKEFTAAQENLNSALLEVGFSSQQGRTSLALMLAPTLTPIINAVADGISKLNINFAELGRTVGNAVKPAIADLFKLFTSGGQVDSSQLGSSFGKAINEVVIPAFQGLKKIAVEAAHSLSELFGGDVSPALVAIGLAVTALIGPFNALAVAVLAVFGSSSPAISQFKETLKSIGVDVDAIKQKFVQTWNELRGALRGDESTKGTLGAELAEGLKELPRIILEVVAALVLLRSGAAFLARTGLFGKSISGDALIGVAAIGQVTGAFSALRDIVAIIAGGIFALFNTLRIVGFVLAPFVAALAIITGIPAAVIAAIAIGLAALVAGIYLYWDEIKKGAKDAWDFVASTAQAAWEKIKSTWVASVFNSVWEGIKDGAKDAWDFVIAKIDAALAKLREFLGVQKAGEEQHKQLDEAPSAQKDFKLRPGRYVRPAPEGEGGGAIPDEGGGGGEKRGEFGDYVRYANLDHSGGRRRTKDVISGYSPETNLDDGLSSVRAQGNISAENISKAGLRLWEMINDVAKLIKQGLDPNSGKLKDAIDILQNTIDNLEENKQHQPLDENLRAFDRMKDMLDKARERFQGVPAQEPHNDENDLAEAFKGTKLAGPLPTSNTPEPSAPRPGYGSGSPVYSGNTPNGSPIYSGNSVRDETLNKTPGDFIGPVLGNRTVDPSKLPKGYGPLDPEKYASDPGGRRRFERQQSESGYSTYSTFPKPGPLDPEEYARDPGGRRRFEREQRASGYRTYSTIPEPGTLDPEEYAADPAGHRRFEREQRAYGNRVFGGPAAGEGGGGGASSDEGGGGPAAGGLLDGVRDAAQGMKDAFSALKDPITAVASAFSALKDIVTAVADAAKQAAQSLSSIQKSGSDSSSGSEVSGGAFAAGGRPPSGVPSLVGEQGPELFVPDRAGTVLPNSLVSSMFDGLSGLSDMLGNSLRDLPAASQGAGGGGNQRILNLTIGGETFAGLAAPDDKTADRLERFALSSQVSSIGRAPSWVGK